MTTVEATEYIKKNKNKVNQEFRLHYHGMPECGWMNDPNGLSFFQDSYHLFYQHYPYDSIWGAMHWGHMVSKDLIKFDYLPVALAPDREDESGCFSGGAIVDQNNQNKLHLFYTKHLDKDGEITQTQAMATSEDGVHFIKKTQPIITKEMTEDYAIKSDVRDPYPIYINGWYYIILGAKGNDDKGKYLIFRSKDLNEFTFHDEWMDESFGLMAECPDLNTISNTQVFLYSIIYKDEKNIQRNESRYIMGDIDLENKRYQVNTNEIIDRGHHFYAPQTIKDDKGRTILIGWMEMWGDKTVTHDLGHRWQGALTFPRVLTVKDQILFQYPIEELKKYRENTMKINHVQEIPKQVDIETINTDKPFTMYFYNASNEEEHFCIAFDGKYVLVNGETIQLNALTKKQTKNSYKEVKLRILADTSSFEVFVNEGIEVFTSRVYIPGSSYVLRTDAEGEIHTLKVDDAK